MLFRQIQLVWVEDCAQDLYHGFEGLSLITVPIHVGEARGRGQLSFDNPDCHGMTNFYHSYYTERELFIEKSSAGMISYPENI